VLDGAVLDAAALPLRAAIGDPADLRRRPVLAALTTLVLGTGGGRDGGGPDGGVQMVLHWRDPAKVATGGGLYTTAPVGMFQPSSDARWNVPNDFGLRRCLVRELNEELLGGGEDYGSDVRPIDYPGWPLYQQLADGLWWLGLGIDPLSLVIDMLAVAVVDDALFGRLVGGSRANDEGRLIIRDFSETSIGWLIAEENVEPASAALLRLAWQHRDRLLRSRSDG
jgi:hypothetical protein